VLSQLEAHAGAVELRFRGGLRLFHLKQSAVGGGCFLVQILWNVSHIFVVEVFDFGAQVRFFLVERGDTKPALADRQKVEASIRIALQDAIDQRRAAYIDDIISL
jgi:hypothetical protein